MSIKQKDKNIILDKAYPVGCYYLSNDNSKKPGELFGGTWRQITGAFLRATTSNIAAGSQVTAQGGHSYQTIPSNFLPAHTHTIGDHRHTYSTTHSHSYTSNQSRHTHTGTSHSHTKISRSHYHTLKQYQAPPGTILSRWKSTTHTNNYATYFKGSYSKLGGETTGMTKYGGGSHTAASSASTTPSQAGSNYSSFASVKTTVNNASKDTNYSGSNSAGSVDITPPYISCFCWRRER